MLRTLLKPIARLVLRIFFRHIEIKGCERIATGRPLIFVANHPNVMLDVLLLGVFAPADTLRFIGKSTLFKNPLYAWFLIRLGVIPVIIRHAPRSLSCRHVLEQVGMVPFFDAQNVMQVVIVQRSNVRRVGTQTILRHNQLEVGVILTKFGDQALGGIAFTVVFLGAILFDDRLGHQSNDFALIRMDDRVPLSR